VFAERILFKKDLPNPVANANLYLAAVMGCGQSAVNQASEAVSLIRANNLLDEKQWHEGFYWALHNAQLWDDAEAYCRTVAERSERPPLDGSSTMARCFWSHILARHLKRAEEGAEVLRKAAAEEKSDPNLEYFLAQALMHGGKFDEAEHYARTAVSLTFSPRDKAQAEEMLSDVLIAQGKYGEGIQAGIRALENVFGASIANKVAWRIYKYGGDLTRAEGLAARAKRDATGNINILQTHVAILTRLRQWDRAVPEWRQWIASTSAQHLADQWPDYVLAFQDVASLGRMADLATIIEVAATEGVWFMIARACRVVTQGEPAIGECTGHVKKLAFQILRRSADLNFPDSSSWVPPEDKNTG
jgi:tetratricopeptide (TPR) repeat protein